MKVFIYKQFWKNLFKKNYFFANFYLCKFISFHSLHYSILRRHTRSLCQPTGLPGYHTLWQLEHQSCQRLRPSFDDSNLVSKFGLLHNHWHSSWRAGLVLLVDRMDLLHHPFPHFQMDQVVLVDQAGLELQHRD